MGSIQSDSREVPVTERGVKLSYLLHLSTTFDDTMTIAEIVDKVVRPRTLAERCCMWMTLPREQVGKPQYFISHTWSRRLCDLLTILTTHFGIEYTPGAKTSGLDTGPSPLVWLDILAINQHPYLDPKGLLLDDVAALADVIKATKQTLFCLDNKGVVLTRIWCLFEVWHTILAGGASKLVVLANQLDADALKNVFIELDVAQAKATQDQDRVRILEEIRKSMGFHEMNMAIKKALIDSSEHEAANAQKVVLALEEDRETKEPGWKVVTDALKPISKHISMLQMAGRTADANRYSKILTAMQSRLGADGLIKKSPATFPCTNPNVASLLKSAAQWKHDAKLDEAMVEIQAAIEESKRDLRSQAAKSRTWFSAWCDSIACLHSEFLLLKDMGRGKEALATTERALALVQEATESERRFSLEASLLFVNADLLLSVECKAQDAVDACNRALTALNNISSTPSTLDEPLPWPSVKKVEVVSKLSELLLMTSDYNGSAKKWQETADLWLEAGDMTQHLAALSRKAGALDYGGSLQESEEVFRYVIKQRLEIGGPHVNTVAGEYMQLATVLAKTQREEEAFELHQKVGRLYSEMESVKDTEIPIPGKGKVKMVDAYLDGSMLLMTSPNAGGAVRRVLARQLGTGADSSSTLIGGSLDAGAGAEEGADGSIEEITAKAYKAWGAMESSEAERLLRLRIPLLKKKMGTDKNKEVVDAHKLLASFLLSSLNDQGAPRTAEAEAEYRTALALHETLMNGRDPDMADQTLSQLASAVSSQGRGKEAEDIYLRALNLLTSVLGKDHIRTLTIDLQYRGAVFSRVATEAATTGDLNGAEFLEAQAAMNLASEKVTAAAAS